MRFVAVRGDATGQDPGELPAAAVLRHLHHRPTGAHFCLLRGSEPLLRAVQQGRKPATHLAGSWFLQSWAEAVLQLNVSRKDL